MASSTTATSYNHHQAVAKIAEWKKHLITKEDPNRVHKILGILCLMSFIWRFTMIGPNDMGFSDPLLSHLTIPTFLLHWSLPLSSFIFHIPAKRIKTGDRIWPEYRLHALVFSSRSLLCCCVYYYEQIYHLSPNYDLNFMIVMGTLLAADISSWSVDSRSNSIRELDTHPMVKYFFSFMQFGATSACLYGGRRSSIMFYFVFIIQFNPFLMTLRRKNLLSKSVILTIYGMMLLFGMGFGIHEHVFYAPNGIKSFWCIGVIGNTATLLRLGPRLPIIRYLQDNKYLLWLSLGLLLRKIRPYFDVKESSSTSITMIVLSLRLATIFLGIWNGFLRDRYNNKSFYSSEPMQQPTINGATIMTKKVS